MSETTQANFRIPKSLKDVIEQAAIDNNRSITQEFIHALESHYLPKEKRKYIFTDWHPVEFNQEHSPDQNEAVRMACAEYMSNFFKNYPNHELISFEFKKETRIVGKKLSEIIYGIRIWYSYPINK